MISVHHAVSYVIHTNMYLISQHIATLYHNFYDRNSYYVIYIYIYILQPFAHTQSSMVNGVLQFRRDI